MKIDGRFWLTKENQSFLGSGRVELLEKIDRIGSIHAAAKEMKMSYKAAWERINSMNALAERPLIERTTGGKGGGGSKLTPYAHELIATFRRLEELHRQFLERFSQSAGDPERLAHILNRTFLTTSARNQFHARIDSIEPQGLNTKLGLMLEGGDLLYSTITSKSVESMALRVSEDCYAIIKSGDTKLFLEKPTVNDMVNVLVGSISSIETSDERAEVTFRLVGGSEVIAFLTADQIAAYCVGQSAYAVISPNNVIIGL